MRNASEKNENDTIITKSDVESPNKKTKFHLPNQSARKKIAAASISPDPALRIEYTDRLLAEYTNLKCENDPYNPTSNPFIESFNLRNSSDFNASTKSFFVLILKMPAPPCV